MFGLGKLVKGVVATATLPVAVTADVVKDVFTEEDHDMEYTDKSLKCIEEMFDGDDKD